MHLFAPDTELGWEEILRLYDRDDVVAAFRSAVLAGIGSRAEMSSWYRTLEAEATTRASSSFLPAQPGLQVELVPEEVGDSEAVVAFVLSATKQASDALSFRQEVPALVTVLSESADAPWATHPGGYASVREPYTKICVPFACLSSTDEFIRTVAHEYAHVITFHYARDEAERWVEEGVAVLVENDFDPIALEDFRSGAVEWLSWWELEEDLLLDADSPEEEDAVWLAYQQSAWVIRYLDEAFGRERLVHFLQSHSDESVWGNLKSSVQGQTRTESAMKRIYGKTVGGAFGEAHEWIQGEIPGA